MQSPWLATENSGSLVSLFGVVNISIQQKNFEKVNAAINELYKHSGKIAWKETKGQEQSNFDSSHSGA